jgi:Fe-coproporphyrin III synthase
MSLSGLGTALNFVSDRMRRLPLAVVYVTDRCSSKCIGCDFWRHGTAELDVDRASGLARELWRLGTRMALFTGGEPLFHSRWEDVARAFRDQGLSLWLLTSGISLSRARAKVGALFSRVTVSLDGATPATYQATRGVHAFDAVVAGIAALAEDGVWVSIRTTVQRRNFLELPEIVRLARRLGVREISFLPVDVRSRLAFLRGADASTEGLALAPADLLPFESILDEIEIERGREGEGERSGGRIAESPQTLRRMHRYFAAIAGLGDFPVVRCNAPRFSAVVRSDGSIQPCHFIEGHRGPEGSTLFDSLNAPALVAVRKAIRKGAREECLRCVCPMRRAPLDLVIRPTWEG